jgi:hypothetical protein
VGDSQLVDLQTAENDLRKTRYSNIAIKRIETLNENNERLLKRMEQIEQNRKRL